MTHPDGYFNSYGSCSRHIGTPFCWHQQNDTLGHKKSLRLEAIGDNGHPAGLITIFLLALAKVRRIFGTAKGNCRNFWKICRKYVVEHKNEGLRNESVMKWKEKERKGIIRNESE